MDLNEKIIECVRKHKCLYELGHKDYKNSVLKARIWHSIAEQLNERSDTIRKKWKSMRDSYIKHKKQVKGTTGCERKAVHFLWSAQLSFLDSGISLKKSGTNVSELTRTVTPPMPANIIENSNTNQASNSTPSHVPVGYTETPHRTQSSLPSISSIPKHTSTSSQIPLESSDGRYNAKNKTKKNAEQDVDTMILNYINNKKEKTNHDSIDYLFLSYAHTFKQFSVRKQAILKVDLAKLFSDAELSEIPNEQSPCPSIHITDSPTYSMISPISDVKVTHSNYATIVPQIYVNTQEPNSNTPEDLSYNVQTLPTSNDIPTSSEQNYILVSDYVNQSNYDQDVTDSFIN